MLGNVIHQIRPNMLMYQMKSSKLIKIIANNLLILELALLGRRIGALVGVGLALLRGLGRRVDLDARSSIVLISRILGGGSLLLRGLGQLARGVFLGSSGARSAVLVLVLVSLEPAVSLAGLTEDLFARLAVLVTGEFGSGGPVEFLLGAGGERL